MLSVSGLHVAYTNEVLKGISFEASQGSITGIVGPSGGGKSTLLKVIAGLEQAGSGSVFWKEQKIKGPHDQLIPGHEEIQLVNQDFALDLYHTVFQNVIQKNLYLQKDVRDKFALELIELVGLEHHLESKAILLSGGEQQRLSIIRALAAEPEVLLLDEPFAHLDSHLKEKIGDYIRELCKIRKMTCILVSHEGQDVLQWSEKIHFLKDGIIQRTATPQEFYFNPESAYEAKYFGEINELTIDGKKILFRPDEYEVEGRNPEVEIKIISSSFAGYYWRNLACTEHDEKVVLFAQKPLENVTGINVTKQGKKA